MSKLRRTRSSLILKPFSFEPEMIKCRGVASGAYVSDEPAPSPNLTGGTGVKLLDQGGGMSVAVSLELLGVVQAASTVQTVVTITLCHSAPSYVEPEAARP